MARPIRVVSDAARRLAEIIRRDVRERLGPDSTFEQRRDSAAGLTSDALWLDADQDLRDEVTTAAEVEIDGCRYRRLKQRSAAIYFSRWGNHHIKEPLYRTVGVRNGPTIKPIELRAGIIKHMTPDMARIVGELTAHTGSRDVSIMLRITGLTPPSRAFSAKRTAQMAAEIAKEIPQLEQAARDVTAVPTKVGSVSCGLDRMAVRMTELEDPEHPVLCTRTAPYARTPPPEKEHHYRMAWVGSTTVYDLQGNEIHTWRCATHASADPATVALRVAKDVAWITNAHPDVPVHCVQDGAPELRALPEALALTLPPTTIPVELVDFEHLMGYLEDVVDACAPPVIPTTGRVGTATLCSVTTRRSSTSGGGCAALPRRCRVEGPQLARRSRPRSATFVCASRRCATPRTTRRTCRSAAAPPKVAAFRCNNASSYLVNRGSRGSMESSRCAAWRSPIAGCRPGSPTPLDAGRRSGSSHDQERIRRA